MILPSSHLSTLDEPFGIGILRIILRTPSTASDAATERTMNPPILLIAMSCISAERFSAPNPTDSAHFDYFYHVPLACQ